MVTVKPVKLAYQLFEPTGGADKNLSPIIFIHGVSLTKKNWLNIPQLVADRTKRKAYTIDARNHGQTEYTKEYDLDMNVPDLFHFMDTIGARKVIIVGHSMGGIAAMKAALKHPERIEQIVVEDICTKILSKEIVDYVRDELKLWAKSVQSIPKDYVENSAIKLAVDLAYSQIPPDAPFVSPKEVKYNMGLEILKKPDGTYDVGYNYDVVMDYIESFDIDSQKFEGLYNGSSLFIYGDQSAFEVGKEKEGVKKHFPKAEFTEFKKATHSVHSEHPEKFADVVAAFLQERG